MEATRLAGSSMNNLSIIYDEDHRDEEEPKAKEKKGLLRRAFSSRKKKHGGSSASSSSPMTTLGGQLTIPSPHYGRHRPLGLVHSSPLATSHYGDGSPASDLAARRGVFSRRRYGSVEMLLAIDSNGSPQTAGRFRVETGEADCELGTSQIHSPVHLENPEYQTRWYFKYFLGKLHQNYVAMDADKEPFLLSVVVTDANNHNVLQYRAILWSKTGNQKICLPYNLNKPMTVKGILSHFCRDKLERGLKEIFNPELQKDLLVLEEQEGAVNFKFGVIYAKEGQTSDDEMYSNEHAHEQFNKFCHLLGDRVRLKGWEKFRGGLDNKSDTTGTESIYTVYEGHEIIFHVSTSLPYSNENKQQVERKRHIGNDIVNIVFVDIESDKTPTFRPSMMKTHFTHIFAVVTYNREKDSYRLAVFSEESVSLFGPPLPCPPEYTNHQEFRHFLLVKLINGEKAAFNTAVFANKRHRTLDMLIRSLYQEHLPENSKNNMLSRRAFSDLIPETVHGSRHKEEARQLEFLRVGQALKLKTILKGDAPTSLATSGALLKQKPWEPHCFLLDFPYDIVCGDSWGDKLVVATTAGTFVLEEGANPRMIFDKTVIIKQLNIVEAHGLMIFRADKGKESRVHVFRLMYFEGEENEFFVRTKNHCREHKLERTKGCQLYAISRPGSSHLHVVVAVSRRLLVFAWKHSSAWAAWCPVAESDIVDEFQFLRELQSFEVPQLMTIVDGAREGNQICVGYKNQFDLINEKNGDTLQLHQIDANKVNIVSAIDLYEEDEAELLLCYNYIGHFQKLSEDSSQELDFHWNSEPKAIVCAFPYIMAFTADAIEIRLIINGNVVHTMTMPDLMLITSKCDIYFASSAYDVAPCSPLTKESSVASSTPPTSPAVKSRKEPTNIYKIPLMCLAGQSRELAGGAPSSQLAGPRTLLSPLVNSPDRSAAPRPPPPPPLAVPTPSHLYAKRSPLMRMRKLSPIQHLPAEVFKNRHDSNSSSTDSGIHLNRLCSDASPPVSPFFSMSIDDDEAAMV